MATLQGHQDQLVKV
jgi:U3 small nucleolar RNA-associated protein 13